MKGKIITIVSASLLIGGCSAFGPMGPNEAAGTAIGGVTGAVAGASLGGSKGGSVVGAGVGAAAGGLIGGAIGRNADERSGHHHKKRVYRQP